MSISRNRVVHWFEPFDVIIGTDDDDALAGTQGNDTIRGLLGKDLLEGRGGKDRLDGGGGADTLAGGAGRDVLVGGKNGDVFRFDRVTDTTATKPDQITLFKNRDALDLSKIDANALVGGNQDFINVAALTGAAGQLAYSSNGAGGTIVEGDVDGDGVADLRIEIIDDRRDTLVGGDGDDTLIGYDDDETIEGGSGDNVLLGAGGRDRIVGGGNDTLAGGDGNDTIVGRGLRDVIDGGAGDDLIWAETEGGVPVPGSQPDVIDGGSGEDTINSVSNSTVIGGAGHDFIAHFDSGRIGNTLGMLSGGDGDDTITVSEGGGGVNGYVLNGDDGNDVLNGNGTIEGGLGNDTITSGRLDDLLLGGTGKDSIFGGVGSDTIIGGADGDTLDGGGNADVFVYIRVTDSTAIDPDLIVKVANKVIDLSSIDADILTTGDQAFTKVPHFTGTAGELQLRFDNATGNTFIEGDVNGDMMADLSIRVTGDNALFN